MQKVVNGIKETHVNSGHNRTDTQNPYSTVPHTDTHTHTHTHETHTMTNPYLIQGFQLSEKHAVLVASASSQDAGSSTASAQPRAFHFCLDNSASMGRNSDNAKKQFAHLLSTDAVNLSNSSLTIFSEKATTLSRSLSTTADMESIHLPSQGNPRLLYTCYPRNDYSRRLRSLLPRLLPRLFLSIAFPSTTLMSVDHLCTWILTCPPRHDQHHGRR